MSQPQIPQKVTATLATASADTGKRTITGIAACFNQRAGASTGALIFAPGSLNFGGDLRRVKLCLDHDYTKAVGYATSVEMDDAELRMSFYLPETPAGDEALASAKAGIRDGLSVGAYIEPDGAEYDYKTETLTIHNATVREVSLTAVPAIDSARVTHVENSLHDRKETTPMEQPETPTVEAAAPAAPPVVATAPRAPRTVAEAAAMVTRMTMDGASANAIRAALTDITPANDPAGATLKKDSWIGELWEARRTDRPLIDAIGVSPLPHSTKIKGWRWKTRPTVDTYAGNKAEIPSSTVLTEEIEVAPKRIAGGWDIDRIYVDLGDSQMIEALWRGALEDYLAKTEAAVSKDLQAAATEVAGKPATALDALTAMGTTAGKLGTRIDFIAFGADKWGELLDKPADEMPWWVTRGDSIKLDTASGTVNGLRLFMDPSLPAGSILGGDKRAVTFYEETPPVRVNAIDLPRGGVDLALFGYHAMIVHDAKALLKVTTAGVGG